MIADWKPSTCIPCTISKPADRKLYYVVEVDRRPPTKTPIKMAAESKAEKAESKQPEVVAEGAAKCEVEGDDVRETSC